MALDRERFAAVELSSYFGSDDAVGVAEGHVGGDGEVVGTVGGKEFEGAGGNKTLDVGLQVADNQGANPQTVLHKVQRFHEGSLGLLVVHVVAGGEAGDDPENLLL